MAAHYVDNQRFLEEMTKYQQERKEASQAWLPYQDENGEEVIF